MFGCTVGESVYFVMWNGCKYVFVCNVQVGMVLAIGRCWEQVAKGLIVRHEG